MGIGMFLFAVANGCQEDRDTNPTLVVDVSTDRRGLG